MNRIFVNQVGYLPAEKKFAVCEVTDESVSAFFVRDAGNFVVFQGEITNICEDEMAGGKYALIDFSALKQTGVFSVHYGNSQSYPFFIKKNVYNDVFKSTLEYFTLSRCGQEVSHPVFGHPACHTGPADIYGTDQKKEVNGGWHDAGDYGRYIVAGAKTVMDLLFAYEKSGSKVFDILDEVRFELEWMLKMQREDGAVYHKVSGYRFCPFIMPQDEKGQMVLAPVSTTATADFAGCLAYASRFYKSDRKFTRTLLDAAIKAQDYIYKNKDEFYMNPPEISTGNYSDNTIEDEKYFALCSLYSATAEISYLEDAIRLRRSTKPDIFFNGFGWRSFGGYGNEVLFRSKGKAFRNIPKDFLKTITNDTIKLAEHLLEVSDRNIFACPLEKVFWGSNGAVMDCAHVFQLAYNFTKKKEYLDAFKRQIHYILGVNPMNVCYVTGFGTNTVKHPHHRPSGFLKKTMPGMLSGGPGSSLADEVARKELQGQAPLKCFVDKTPSYSTNEVAIYWNSPLCLALAELTK